MASEHALCSAEHQGASAPSQDGRERCLRKQQSLYGNVFTTVKAVILTESNVVGAAGRRLSDARACQRNVRKEYASQLDAFHGNVQKAALHRVASSSIIAPSFVTISYRATMIANVVCNLGRYTHQEAVRTMIQI